MANFRDGITRRTALGGLAWTLAAAAPAFAAPAVRLPLRALYARVGPDGFVTIGSDEQDVWNALGARVGGLIADLRPLQPDYRLAAHAPESDGGAACAMIARTMAMQAGLDYAIIYATQSGRKSFSHKANWLSKGFAAVRSSLTPYGPAIGEAHVLGLDTGEALISVSADAPPRSALNPFDNHRRPQNEALDRLLIALEDKLRADTAAAFRREASIAD
ncbi:MAG: hypothetical protein R3C52_05930 [Hyphomonadaceae bacterium]